MKQVFYILLFLCVRANSQILLSATAPGPAFKPTDIGNLKVWIQADSLALSNTDPVSTWTDLSGTGNTFTEAGANRPTYITNAINGKPIVRFVSSNFMQKASATGVDGVSNLTIIVAVKGNPLAVNNTYFSKWVYATAGGYAFQTDDASTSNFMVYVADAFNDNGGNNVHTSGAALTSNFFILTMVYDGSLTNANRVKFYKNGVLQTTTVNGTIPATLQSSSANLILGWFPGLGRFFNGDFFGAFIYQASLTGTQQALAENWFNAILGLY